MQRQLAVVDLGPGSPVERDQGRVVVLVPGPPLEEVGRVDHALPARLRRIGQRVQAPEPVVDHQGVLVAALALARCALVATWHAAGELGWMRGGVHVWGFLMDRIDQKIAVSRMAAESAERWLGPGFEIVPNGVVIPERADPERREHKVVFIGRHDARKGLPVLLRAWPEIRRRTGARLRLIGTDPLQFRLLHARMRFDDDGIDVLGIVTNEVRDSELATAKAFISPALGGESFGMVLVEAFATATPVVASDIPGFADVSTGEAAVNG